jgi:hypothetical protein
MANMERTLSKGGNAYGTLKKDHASHIVTKAEDWTESFRYVEYFQTEQQSKNFAEGVYRSAEN